MSSEASFTAGLPPTVVRGDDGFAYAQDRFFDADGFAVQGWRRLRTQEVEELGLTLLVSYPFREADTVVLGPQVFASADERVICWKGRNYVPQVHWWDRLLCALRLHVWDYPGGRCEHCLTPDR